MPSFRVSASHCRTCATLQLTQLGRLVALAIVDHLGHRLADLHLAEARGDNAVNLYPETEIAIGIGPHWGCALDHDPYPFPSQPALSRQLSAKSTTLPRH